VYDTILIPTDGTAAAEQAAEHGATLAAFHDAAVHVLYVVDVTSFSGLSTNAVGDDPIAAATSEGEDIVAETAAVVGDRGPDPTTVVEQGVPEETILKYVRQQDIDLTVMGTHGRSGIQRYLAGSVTEAVVRSSPVPVLTLAESDGTA